MKKTKKKPSKKKIIKKNLKKTSKKSIKKVKKKSVVKKNITSKKKPKTKKNLNSKKNITKPKLNLKNDKKNINTKVKKNKITFDDKIKEVFEKLINKYKIDGIYTSKIIEKAIPKKFREDENITKLKNLLTKSNIKIYTEEEAKELNNISKEGNSKSDDAVEGDEKKTDW